MQLGAVPYLNALPLIRYLPERPRLEPPAALDRLLDLGEVDLATAPIVTLFENPSYRLVPGIAIGTRGPVKSVRLIFNRPALSTSDILSLSLDTESKTSRLLLKVLLHFKYGLNLSRIRFSERTPAARTDATLVIGNKALAGAASSLDLGEEWVSWTGLPFVFAAWIGRLSHCPPALIQTLTACRDHALTHLDDVVNGLSDFPRDEAKKYLANVSYELGDAEIEGMKRFHSLARELKLLHHDFQLNFYPCAE